MRKLVIVLLIVFAGVAFFTFQKNNTSSTKIPGQKTSIPSASGNHENSVKNFSEEGLFVPYWTVSVNDEAPQGYTVFYYFGLLADENGVDRTDPGYQKLPVFEQFAQEKKTMLTVRMTNNKTNFIVMQNNTLEKNIISDTIKIAKQYGFSGIVLDLEVSGLPFDSVVRQINNFNQNFASSAHQNFLQFAIALPGDTFVHIKPYDVKSLGSYADKVLLMAYDFHKANGDPGPNFPLRGKEKYGYDFTEMVQDFENDIPKNKIVVVFGMYGYDWPVDSEDNPLDMAKSITDRQIQEKFLRNCGFANCDITRGGLSDETKITYTDSEGKNHIVWFEDEKSKEAKERYLQKLGISQAAIWSYGYF